MFCLQDSDCRLATGRSIPEMQNTYPVVVFLASTMPDSCYTPNDINIDSQVAEEMPTCYNAQHIVARATRIDTRVASQEMWWS